MDQELPRCHDSQPETSCAREITDIVRDDGGAACGDAEASNAGRRQLQTRVREFFARRFAARLISLPCPEYSFSSMSFEIIGALVNIETIATGREIRELARLQKAHGKGRWRKRKGVGKVRLPNGNVHTAEIHWYEAHGIGRKEQKIKRFLP